MRRADHSSRGALWMSVCCYCCVLSGRGLCVELITRSEESYGYLSVVSIVFCQVEVSATSWSLVQRSPMDACLLWLLGVLSGRGLCVELITRPEESYWVRCVWVWSWSLDNEGALPHWGLLCHGKKYIYSKFEWKHHDVLVTWYNIKPCTSAQSLYHSR